MKNIQLILICILSIFFSNCAQIINGAVLPNQCKKCELIDAYNGSILFILEGCGSENTRLEEQCQEKAWELSRGKNLCDFEIRCNSWRKIKE